MLFSKIMEFVMYFYFYLIDILEKKNIKFQDYLKFFVKIYNEDPLHYDHSSAIKLGQKQKHGPYATDAVV